MVKSYNFFFVIYVDKDYNVATTVLHSKDRKLSITNALDLFRLHVLLKDTIGYEANVIRFKAMEVIE